MVQFQISNMGTWMHIERESRPLSVSAQQTSNFFETTQSFLQRSMIPLTYVVPEVCLNKIFGPNTFNLTQRWMLCSLGWANAFHLSLFLLVRFRRVSVWGLSGFARGLQKWFPDWYSFVPPKGLNTSQKVSSGSHSAVFKFCGLLRLLNINLIKHDKPIS